MGPERKRIIVHIDMNSYFASVEQASDPKLRGKPIAVGGGIGKRTVVATASYEARALGVKTGMSTWEALKICPKLIVVAGDMEKYSYTSREIIKIFRKYTDCVEVFSIDEAFLDITGTADRFGGAKALCTAIKDEIKEMFRLTCSAGIASNKLVAKLASSLQKPDGLVEVTEDELPQILEFLPIEELCGVGRKLKKHLNAMGIMTCSDLGRYPLHKLIKRFGKVCGIHLSNMGKGIDHSPVDPKNNIRDAKSVSHSYTLPRNETDPEEVKNYLLQLCEQVGRRARKDGYKGRVVRIFIRYGDFSGFGRQKNTGEYVDDGLEIYKHCLTILTPALRAFPSPSKMERGRRVERAGGEDSVRLVGVALTSLIKDTDQVSFIEAEEDKKKVLHTVDKINDRYGEFTVTRASIMHNKLQQKTGMIPRVN